MNSDLIARGEHIFLLKGIDGKKHKINICTLAQNYFFPNYHYFYLEDRILGKKIMHFRFRLVDKLQKMCWIIKSNDLKSEALLLPTDDYNNFFFFMSAEAYLKN